MIKYDKTWWIYRYAMDCYPWGENGRNIMDDFAEKSLWTWGNTIENFANLAQSSHSSFGGERHSEVRTPPSFAKEYFTHHWGIFSLQKCSSAIQVFLWKRLLCWARTGKVMLLSDAKSGGLSFWRTTGTMKYDEIWLNMMKYDEVFTCCELPPVVMCCFGQMWFFGTSDMLRIEQLQTLPPGLQMMLLNTEVEKTAGKSSETQRTLSRNSAKAIAGGYEERLIEALHRGTTAPRHCAVNDPTPWWLDSNWFKLIQMDSNGFKYSKQLTNESTNKSQSPEIPWFPWTSHGRPTSHLFWPARSRTSCLGGMACSRNTLSASPHRGAAPRRTRRITNHIPNCKHFFVANSQRDIPGGTRKRTTMDRPRAWSGPRDSDRHLRHSRMI